MAEVILAKRRRSAVMITGAKALHGSRDGLDRHGGLAPSVQYTIAGVLLAIGVVLWFVTVTVKRSQTRDTSKDELPPTLHTGPTN